MTEVTVKELLEAGVHFGHQKRKWNPRMAEHILGERSGVYIIDLEHTIDGMKKVAEFLDGIVSSGGLVLFVGTKRQAKETVTTEAARCEMPYVSERWLGGTLTNFMTVQSRKRHLEDLIEKEKEPDPGMSKKDLSKQKKERLKLGKYFGGMIGMDKIPAALFVVDVHKERIAVSEANKLNIPVIGIVDTNCDPNPIQFQIPGNDDATRSIAFIVTRVADMIVEMRKEISVESENEEEKTEAAEEKE